MLNKEFYEIVLELRKQNKTWIDIHKHLLKTKLLHTSTTVGDIKDRYMDIATNKITGNNEDTEDEVSSFDCAVEKVNNFIGRENKKVKTKKESEKESKTKKILVISDVHVPYFESSKLARALEIGKEHKCTELVINGDFLNGDRLSTHAKFKFESFKDEIAEGRALLELFCKTFEKVYLLDDNHVHDRWRRFLGSNISPDLHFLLTHPYDYLCSGLDNLVRSAYTHEKFQDEVGHCLFVGDAMFSHGFVSGKDGASVRTVQQWYSKWKPVLNFPTARVFLHGHTHSLGINFDFDSAIIQTGTLASMEGLRYSLEGHLRSSPPIHGCIVLEQEKGHTKLDSIRVFKL
jgi:predicted phosphodiesterase